MTTNTNTNPALDFMLAILHRDAVTLRQTFGVTPEEVKLISLADQTAVAGKLLAANNAVLAAKSKKREKPLPVTPPPAPEKATFHTAVPASLRSVS